MKKYIFLILILFLFSCNNQDDNLKIIEGNAIGTSFSIRYLDRSNIDFTPKIDGLIKAINKSTSTYIPTSDISRINKGDTTVVLMLILRRYLESPIKFIMKLMVILILLLGCWSMLGVLDLKKQLKI